MSNPYQPTPHENPFGQPTPGAWVPPSSDNNWIKHIPIVGILNIVQAVLELMMAALGVVLTVFFGMVASQPKFQEELNKNGAVPMPLVMGIYVLLAVGMTIVGGTRLVAGIMILRRRGRTFAMVSSALGLLSVFSCYCSITSIAVCVYTVLVLLNGAVEAEFAKRKLA